MTADTSRAEPVLAARGITKVFPGTIALDAVDFALTPGRVHALIGENGAGKSTLARILAGAEQPTSGTLLLDGAPVRFASAGDAARRGIGIVHQELQTFPDLSVMDNLFVGRDRVTPWRTIDRRTEMDAGRAALARLRVTVPPGARLGTLPLGQQQIVEIARALVHETRILLMDEPTSALTLSEIPVLFQVIRDLTSHGVSIVYISHRLEELLEIADTVTVLRDGRVVGDAPVADASVGWIVERMTGRAAAAAATHAPVPASSRALLRVSGLTLPARPGRSALHGVSLDVRAGEVVGLYGLMGAGRTELLESVMGAHADARGIVEVDGHSMSGHDVSDRIAAGSAMVPEDRQAAGLVNTLSVEDNLTLSSLPVLARWGYLSPAATRQSAARLVADLRIKAASLDAPITSLSGGNQQKVIIGRGLMRRPRVLLFDEPTRGVDVGAKTEILDAMRRLAGEGVGVVFASSDLDEIRSIATRVLVMARGRITAEFDAAHASDHALASAASASVSRGTDAVA